MRLGGARAAGVSPDTVVRWEAERGQRPHPSALSKIAGALGTEPAALLEDQNHAISRWLSQANLLILHFMDKRAAFRIPLCLDKPAQN